jgi:mannose-6-phosphate isomerase
MAYEAYFDWIGRVALPAWLNIGRDNNTHFFFERLHLDQAPDRAAPLRTRTQFRQLYVWSHAAVLGLVDPDRAITEAVASATALRGALWAKGNRPGWARAMSLAGVVVDPAVDLYDHACVLLGLAWLLKATGDQRYRDWIDETLAAQDGTLAASNGGWAEDDRGTLPRRQNPHMHQFEAMLALYEVTREPRFLEIARSLLQLFERAFFDPKTGSLREYFGADWLPGAEWQSDDRLEPGHHCEWVWLLRRYQRLEPAADVGPYCAALLARAVAVGAIPPFGFLALEVDGRGVSRQPTQRLWAQAEYMKALIVEGQLAEAEAVFAKVKRAYLDTAPAGTWIDALTLTNDPAAAHIPASSLYHLLTAAPEIRLHVARDR